MDLSKLTAAVLALTLAVFPIAPAPAVAADTADTTAAAAAEETPADTPAAPAPTEAATAAATTAVAEATTAVETQVTAAATTAVTKAEATKPAATQAATKAATKPPVTKEATATAAVTTEAATVPVTTVPVTTMPAEKMLEPVFKYFDKNLVNAKVNVSMPENATAELLVTFDSPECRNEPYYKSAIAAGEKVSFALEGYDSTDPVNDFRSYKAAVRVKGGEYGAEYTYVTDSFTVPDPNDHPDSAIELNIVVSVDSQASAKTEEVKLEGNTFNVTLHLGGYKKGDVNNDGVVDSNDASMVLEEYAAASTGAAGKFGEREKIAGDINADGIIGSDDASAILGYYAAVSTGGEPVW
jgi:hypothetical protein